MCSRYFYDEATAEAVRRIADRAERSSDMVCRGDIRPTERAVIIAGADKKLYTTQMQWGFRREGQQLLINARAESALERKTFRDSILHRRCVIPAAGFYEWNRSREKVTFTRPEKTPVYMAGCYRRYEDQLHFVILTTAANESVAPVHDRMPLILQEDQIRDWIEEEERVEAFPRMSSPWLERYKEYEQLSLF